MNTHIGIADESGMPMGVAVERVRNKETCVFAECAFRQHFKTHVLHLLPAPVLGCQQYGLSPRRRRMDRKAEVV